MRIDSRKGAANLVPALHLMGWMSDRPISGSRAVSNPAGAPTIAAHAAGLRYATDQAPGIRRHRCGKGFRYVAPSGKPVTDDAILKRIRALVIPPAWTDVWIAVEPNAHLQATGRDARRRKQYRYHTRWREVRHQTKYDRLVPFARALAQIRRRVTADLRQAALTKTKVVAAVVQLLEKTLIRVGNSEYARTNGSYGLTTLRDGHVRIRGSEVHFQFKGKSGIKQMVTLADSRLARIVRRCQDLPGQELFQYIDETGDCRPVTSADVNAYLRAAAGEDFTAKDFRTWTGTLLAASALSGRRPRLSRASSSRSRPPSKQSVKSAMLRAIEEVARQLGNTSAVCRACYIHPAVLAAFADGTLSKKLARGRRRRRGLSPDECAVLGLLENQRDWRDQLAEAARIARRKSAKSPTRLTQPTRRTRPTRSTRRRGGRRSRTAHRSARRLLAGRA
jgi:DNA topoisomerase-1